jgi:hypothetical protein
MTPSRVEVYFVDYAWISAVEPYDSSGVHCFLIPQILDILAQDQNRTAA